MKNVEFGFFFTAFVAIIGALIITAVNEASFNISQVLLTLALVLITCIYAMRTSDIAKATRAQADASVKMAEEIREQRYSESLPLLVPDITQRSIVDKKLESNEVDYGTLQTGVGLKVTWHNLGKGVAINTRLSFSSPPLDSHPGKSLYFPPRESKALGVASKESISFEPTSVGWGHQLVDQTKPRLEAEYLDIYKRKITTVQKFRIDEQAQRAFLGELYFTLNGRRFGEEGKNND